MQELTPKIINTLNKKYKDEKVLVIPFNEVNQIPDKFNYIKEYKALISTLFNKGIFLYRKDVEYRPIFQQLIPYIVIKKDDKYLIAKRIAGEERLVNMYSAGFGGHINPIDYSLESAAYRELNEELEFKTNKKLKFIGFVRDLTNTTPDHLGVVFILDVDSVKIKEKENLEGIFMDLKELMKNFNNFESWSKFIIDYLFEQSEEKGVS